VTRHAILVSLGLLWVVGSGCGPTDSPQDQPLQEQASEESSLEAGTTEESPNSSQAAGDDPVPTARNCTATCSGVKSTGESCSVLGFGSTTFLGGCTKACRRAMEDANAKAAVIGCILSYCSTSCR
jgi:hypothetical protein